MSDSPFIQIPTLDLAALESAINTELGIETPHGISYVDEIVYYHDETGAYNKMNSDVQEFAQSWIAANK